LDRLYIPTVGLFGLKSKDILPLGPAQLCCKTIYIYIERGLVIKLRGVCGVYYRKKNKNKKEIKKEERRIAREVIN
jgi:hypothetical protein